MKKVKLVRDNVLLIVIIAILTVFTTMQGLASINSRVNGDNTEQHLEIKIDDTGQVSEITNEAINLELNKEYSVKDFKFSIQSVKIYKESYPMGMFSGRPSNPNMDPSYDGVLGIKLTLKNGKDDAFSQLEKYLVNEDGKKNVKEDMMVMAKQPEYTILFNIPVSARKIKLNIGGLELNLEKIINESNEN